MHIDTQQHRIKACRHGTMMYLRTDSAIGRSLDLYGEWCEHELQVLGRFIAPRDWILDVGANIGTHTVFFARATGPRGRVTAVEPQSLVQHILHANIALNDLENVRVVAGACGSAPGKMRAPRFRASDARNVGGYALDAQSVETEVVKIVTVDSLKLKRCHLIKIDVEGAELDVLGGASETIAAHRPLMWIENNEEEKSPALVERLRALGYGLFWHFDTRFNPQNYFGAEKDIFAKLTRPSSNMLAVPVEAEATFSDRTRDLQPVSDTPIADQWARWQEERGVHA